MTDEEKIAADTAAAEAEEKSEDDKEKVDDEPAEDPQDTDESEDEEKSEDTDNEMDLDAEIEAEKKRGKPDPVKAADAFKKRQQKREASEVDADESEEDIDEDDKPMTRREAREMLAATQKLAQETQALTIAKTLAESDKEAELIVLKWKNRTFPEGTPLSDQIEEAYAVTHRKKLIGQREEALRGLRNKDNVNRNPANSHRDAPAGKEPKLPPQEVKAWKEAGLEWSTTGRRYEKKLKNGDLLVVNMKTKQLTRIPKR